MKRTPLLLTLLMILLVAAGCSTTAAVSLDVDKTAGRLSTEIVFQDQLTHQDKDASLKLYDLTAEDVEAVSLYVGTGATAEEVSVWQGKNETAAKAIEQAVNTRIENQKESYVDYQPQEMPKLENPVVVVKGNYVALCISGNNEKAKEIINGSFQ